jgi:mRNA-degrading endonuclease RelE of RelBE toxin-antitoxin system
VGVPRNNLAISTLAAPQSSSIAAPSPHQNRQGQERRSYGDGFNSSGVKRIAWTDQAKVDIRSLDKPAAMRILSALHRFASSGAGDLKMLQGGIEELRLRIGDYRLFFVHADDDTIEIRRVRHRRCGLPLSRAMGDLDALIVI